MAYIERRISFDHERDSDIVVYLDSMTSHKANQLVRQLLRDHIKDERSTQLDRIEDRLARMSAIIERMKSEGISVNVSNDNNSNDDLRLEALEFNLDQIGI